MQPFSFFFLAIRWGGISGRVRALNLTVPLGSGRVGSDNLGYGPGSGFSFEPVQTSRVHRFVVYYFGLFGMLNQTALSLYLCLTGLLFTQSGCTYQKFRAPARLALTLAYLCAAPESK